MKLKISQLAFGLFAGLGIAVSSGIGEPAAQQSSTRISSREPVRLAQRDEKTAAAAQVSSTVSASQILEANAGKFALPHWFEIPEAIQARVMWRTKSPSKGISRWQWSDVGAANHGKARTLDIATLLGSGGYDAGAGGPVFSPDAQRVLFWRGRPNQEFDSHHDTVLADLGSGKSFLWRDGLFGSSEAWSPDSSKIAFVAGSLDTIFGSPVDPPLRLRVRGTQKTDGSAPVDSPSGYSIRLTPNQETELRIDDHLDRDSLVWTKNGDLLAGTSWWTRPNNNDPRLEATQTPLILRFAQAKGKAAVWQSRASLPVPSPDGKHIAFFGPQRNSDGTWNETLGLCVADESGKNRRTLARLPQGDTRAYFAPDNRHIVLFNLQSDYEWDGSYSSPSPVTFPRIPVRIQLLEFDIFSGQRRVVAALSAVYGSWYEGDEPDLFDFSPLGLSRDGKNFFLARREMKKSAKGYYGEIVANTLYVLRLSDGKLLPVAVFPADLALAPL